MQHDYNHLITLFNHAFAERYNTELSLGGDEPIYLPADKTHPTHRLIFARGFFASALHEIAHWCVAGEKRRLLEDYGYWYQPDGRDEKVQAEFETVEVVPQALEWVFSASCGFAFHVSCDNLSGVEANSAVFREKVRKQVLVYLEQGMPERADVFAQCLRTFYSIPPLCIADFKQEIFVFSNEG